MAKTSGKLNNAFTHFGNFTWGEDEKIKKALEALRDKVKDAPIRFRVKL